MKAPSKREALYLVDSLKNRGQAVYFTLANALDKNPIPIFEACTHLESDHDPMYVVDKERAEEDNFQFFPTLNSCVIWFATIAT